MSFFEIFNPALAHWRKQRDFDKVRVMHDAQGGRGPLGIDLDQGVWTPPGHGGEAEPAPPVTRGEPEG